MVSVFMQLLDKGKSRQKERLSPRSFISMKNSLARQRKEEKNNTEPNFFPMISLWY
jgi:hypothetical protein